MLDELRVEPATLDGKAAALQDAVVDSSSSPSAPCSFDFVVIAAQQVSAAASSLKSFTATSEAEASRLAAVLSEAASVYRKVDERAQVALSQDPPQPVPAEPEPVNPHLPPSVPPVYAAPPDGPPGGDIGTALDGGPKAAAQVLASGDPSSMADYADSAQSFSGTLTGRADTFTPAGLQWEGTSAEAAGNALKAQKAWLEAHSARYQYVAFEARNMADDYRAAKDAHPTVQECQAAEDAVVNALKSEDPGAMNRALEAYQKLVTHSEEVLTSYSAASTGKKLLPFEPPPNGAAPFGAISGNGNPFTPGQPKAGGQPAPGGAESGGGGPSSPGQGPTSSPSTDPAASGAPSSGKPSGGESPSGSGSPSGAGMPSLPGGGPSKDLPKLPTDPSLHPAAADAGGGAGGGSGGGSGGGAGPMPLQPSVGGVSVGPGPAGGAAAGAGPPGAGPGSGAGGGMGGMPMGGHGQGQGGSKERRRTPGLTPDEDLYTEERPWTEAIIGNRRRKDVQDPKDSK